MRKLLLVVTLPLMSSCGAVSHMTDSLTCVGFCQRTRVEHETTPPQRPNPTNKENQQ